MKKRYIASVVGAASAGALAGYLLRDQDSRDMLKQKVGKITSTVKNVQLPNQHTILKEAGMPDQVGDGTLESLENAKMVSEGSQYGVSYYNEVRSESGIDDRGDLQ